MTKKSFQVNMCKSKWLPLILDGKNSEQRGSGAAAKAGRDAGGDKKTGACGSSSHF